MSYRFARVYARGPPRPTSFAPVSEVSPPSPIDGVICLTSRWKADSEDFRTSWGQRWANCFRLLVDFEGKQSKREGSVLRKGSWGDVGRRKSAHQLRDEFQSVQLSSEKVERFSPDMAVRDCCCQCHVRPMIMVDHGHLRRWAQLTSGRAHSCTVSVYQRRLEDELR